jgi:hypothetical protein
VFLGLYEDLFFTLQRTECASVRKATW